MRAMGWVAMMLVLEGCQGFFRQDCFPNATCREGLVCVQGICLNDEVDGGGGSVDCAAGCKDWETCQPGAGGVCRAVRVDIVSPDSGSVFGGGSAVRVTARVTEWDGGVWAGVSIPSSAQLGVVAPLSMARGGGGVFEGDFGLPNQGGTWTLTGAGLSPTPLST